MTNASRETQTLVKRMWWHDGDDGCAYSDKALHKRRFVAAAPKIPTPGTICQSSATNRDTYNKYRHSGAKLKMLQTTCSRIAGMGDALILEIICSNVFLVVVIKSNIDT